MDADLPVISGAALICPLGCDLEEVARKLWAADADRDYPPIPLSPMERPVLRVEQFDARQFLADKKTVRFMSRETRFAVCTLQFCLADAAVRVDQTHAADDIAFYAGTGSGGIDIEQIEKLLLHSVNQQTGRFDLERFGREALNQLNPLTSFKILPNMPPAVAAIYAGVKGSNLIFNPWEGHALLAFREAVWAIRCGRERLVLCSGSDCKTHTNALLTFAEYGLLENSGVILSEGSACVALESLRDARNRKAPLCCTVRGVTHRSHVLPDNLGYACAAELFAELMTAVLAESALTPADIDLILGSGDLHGENDAAELQAIQQVTGPSCPVRFPKKRMGNAVAAAGMMHLALAAHLLKTGRLPNGERCRRILINSFGPGSELFCIILEAVCNAS